MLQFCNIFGQYVRLGEGLEGGRFGGSLLDLILIDFGSFLATKRALKLLPKSTKKSVNFSIRFLIHFVWFWGAQIYVKRLPKTIKNITFFRKTSGTDFSCYGKVRNLDYCNTFHTKTLFLQCDQIDILNDFGTIFGAKMQSKVD